MTSQKPTLRNLLEAAPARPWETMDFDGDQFLVLPAGRAGAFIANCRSQRDADLIATAVNVLPDLLDALTDARQALRDFGNPTETYVRDTIARISAVIE